MSDLSNRQLETLLTALGELLGVAGTSCTIVVVGGAAMNLLGWVERTTEDVDVLALYEPGRKDGPLLRPEPLPHVLSAAIARVARDFGLPFDWMNTEVALQWDLGIPSFFSEGIEWRDYASLRVGLVGRRTLVALKLYAAVDSDLESVHYQDLISLEPSAEELRKAEQWVLTQDAGAEFPGLMAELMSHVRRDLGRDR